MLAAGARGLIGVDLEIRRPNLHLRVVLYLRQDGDRCGARVNPPLCFRGRDALNAVHSGFVLQDAIGLISVDRKNDLFIASSVTQTLRNEFHLHSGPFGKAHIHAREIAGKDRSFVASGTGADFHEDVLGIVGILRHHQRRQLFFERGGAIDQRAVFFKRQVSQLTRFQSRKLFVGVDLRAEFGDLPVRLNRWLE